MKTKLRMPEIEKVFESHLANHNLDLNSIVLSSYWNGGSQIFECVIDYDGETDIAEFLKVQPSPPNPQQLISDFLDRYETMLKSNARPDNPVFTELQLHAMEHLLQMRLFMRSEIPASKVAS